MADPNDKKDAELSEFKQKIQLLTRELEKNGNCTVGEFFYELLKQGKKIRRDWRAGRVEHYEPEFRKICAVQKISAEIEKKLHQAIFFQRPLRSQKHLVGNCSLETKRPRCMISHPFFERYRMLAFINSVKLTFDDGSTRFLSDEERAKVQSAFFVKEPSFKFEKIIKILYPKYKKDGPERFFNYKPEKTVSSCPVTHQLQKVLETDDLFTWRRTYTGPREAWGVQGIGSAKDRSNHIHHAIDAMVLAALTEKYYKRITTAFREDEEKMNQGARHSFARRTFLPRPAAVVRGGALPTAPEPPCRAVFFTSPFFRGLKKR